MCALAQRAREYESGWEEGGGRGCQSFRGDEVGLCLCPPHLQAPLLPSHVAVMQCTTIWNSFGVWVCVSENGRGRRALFVCVCVCRGGARLASLGWMGWGGLVWPQAGICQTRFGARRGESFMNGVECPDLLFPLSVYMRVRSDCVFVCLSCSQREEPSR